MSYVKAYRRHVLRRRAPRHMSYRDAIRHSQHGPLRIESTPMDKTRTDHVGQCVKEMLYHFGDPNWGWTLYRLSDYGTPGFKVSAYWPHNDGSATSESYVFRNRVKAIRAAQHRLALNTWGSRCEARHKYVGDYPFAESVIWHREREY